MLAFVRIGMAAAMLFTAGGTAGLELPQETLKDVAAIASTARSWAESAACEPTTRCLYAFSCAASWTRDGQRSERMLMAAAGERHVEVADMVDRDVFLIDPENVSSLLMQVPGQKGGFIKKAVSADDIVSFSWKIRSVRLCMEDPALAPSLPPEKDTSI